MTKIDLEEDVDESADVYMENFVSVAVEEIERQEEAADSETCFGVDGNRSPLEKKNCTLG